MQMDWTDLYLALPLELQRHCDRTAVYAWILSDHAEQLEELYPQLERQKIRTAIMFGAKYHDLGKLAISHFVLGKSGKLTATERKIVQNHPAYSAELLEENRSDTISPETRSVIIETARYHHERPDGTGYPYGIGGNEIPFTAQLCAIADVFDALSVKRD